MCRLETLSADEDSISIMVKKFGKVSLEDQVTGRMEHKVTVADIAITRKAKRRSLPSQFKYTCDCVAVKDKCIHIGLVVVTSLSPPPST